MEFEDFDVKGGTVEDTIGCDLPEMDDHTIETARKYFAKARKQREKIVRKNMYKERQETKLQVRIRHMCSFGSKTKV